MSAMPLSWPMTTLGEYVSRLRIERGWSLRDLAKKAGVSFGAIQDIEDGSTSSPGLKVIVGVANALRALSTRVLVFLMGLAGLRRNEAIAVELGHVDFEQGFIWVMDGKGNRDGIAPMPFPLEQAIRAWLEVRPESNFQNLLLLNDGTPLTESAILRRVTRLAVAVKSKDLTPHGLRRAAATYWHNDKGLSLHQTSVLLRHRNVSTTQGYLMTDVRDLIQSMRRPETPPEESRAPLMAGILD